MTNIILKIIELVSDFVKYMQEKQLIDSGYDKAMLEVSEESKNDEEKIKNIQKRVDDMSTSDVERLLGIDIKKQ